MYNAKIGWCHVCKQGWVSIVKSQNELYCFCDECETEWESPETFLRKKEGTHFVFTSAEDASDNEIKLKGWDRFISKD